MRSDIRLYQTTTQYCTNLLMLLLCTLFNPIVRCHREFPIDQLDKLVFRFFSHLLLEITLDRLIQSDEIRGIQHIVILSSYYV